MTQTSLQLWQRLKESGLVSGSLPEREDIAPWYISALMAFLGWLAALFLLGFLGLGLFQIFDSQIAALVVGGLMIGGAYFLLRQRQSAFFDYFSLAISLAGQVLVLWALDESTSVNNQSFWIVMMVLQIALVMLMNGTVHRVFSAYLACIALVATLILSGAQYLGSSLILFGVIWLWLNEFRYPQYQSQIRSVGYGLVFALINIKGALLIPFSSGFWWGRQSQPDIWIQPWMGQLLSAALFLYLIWRLIEHYSTAAQKKSLSRLLAMSLLAAALISAASFEAPGIVTGLSILLLGFFASNRILMGLGCVSLLFYISAYYYLLDTTLLMKSMSLLLLGLVLIMSRFCLPKLLPEPETDA